MRILQLLLALTCTFACGQTNSTKNQYVSDFNEFIKYLEETHPDPYSSFGGKIDFRHQVQKIRGNLEKITESENFKDILTGFVVQLEDGHTFINSNSSSNNNGSDKYLPIVFKVVTDALFIEKTTKEYMQYIGDKLLAINNINIDELLLTAQKFGEAENKYGVMLNLCESIVNWKKAKKTFGDISIIELTLQNSKNDVYHIEVEYIAHPDWNSTNSKINVERDNNLLYYSVIKDGNIGYLAWNSVVSREVLDNMDSDNPQFQNTINWAYNAMQQKRPKDNSSAVKDIPELYYTFHALLKEMEILKSEYLIIDLRNNSGGMTPLCLPLLYMLCGDDYLNYSNNPQYITLISPLLLKKWGFSSIEEYNKRNNTNFVLGDYIYRNLLPINKDQSIDEKRKDYSLITYNGAGRQYTEDLNGQPIYRPHILVLSSPKTFSAAYHFMYYLREIGNATVVGVPSRQAGNTFMESTLFELPHSKINGSISNSKQIMFPDNPEVGKILMPDFPMTWIDYIKYNFDKDAELLYCIDIIKQGRVK